MVKHIVASRAKVPLLHIGKQCNCYKNCKKLVEGSAPKPLKTRAYALWLWGMSATYPVSAFVEK